MKFKVTYEYRGEIIVEVEAENADEAEKLGMAEAEESIVENLSLYDVNVRKYPEDDRP